jgi:hypothetical protein
MSQCTIFQQAKIYYSTMKYHIKSTQHIYMCIRKYTLHEELDLDHLSDQKLVGNSYPILKISVSYCRNTTNIAHITENKLIAGIESKFIHNHVLYRLCIQRSILDCDVAIYMPKKIMGNPWEWPS